jgi:phosphohistidine phosphatase
MKTLYLVRHASASIDSPTKKDIDRPLNHSGISEAEAMATYLRKRGEQMNLIVSSSAVRAMVTAHVIAKHFFYPLQEIRKEEVIFLNDVKKNIDLLATMNNSMQYILFVGHNPSITEMANLLCSQPVSSSFKPAAVACIQFDIETWQEISNTGVLKFYADPSTVSI